MEQDESLPSPDNCVEFITEDGRRFAWSESNIQYEEVPQDGGSFTVLRQRLKRAETRITKGDKLADAARKAVESPWAPSKVEELRGNLAEALEDWEEGK